VFNICVSPKGGTCTAKGLSTERLCTDSEDLRSRLPFRLELDYPAVKANGRGRQAHNTQHTTHNTQHTTQNTRHTTHDTQHTTSINLFTYCVERTTVKRDLRILTRVHVSMAFGIYFFLFILII